MLLLVKLNYGTQRMSDDRDRLCVLGSSANGMIIFPNVHLGRTVGLTLENGLVGRTCNGKTTRTSKKTCHSLFGFFDA